MGGSSKGNKTSSSSSPAADSSSSNKKRHRKHRNEADELDTSEHKQDLKRLRAYSGDDAADVAKRVRTRSMDAAEEKKLLQPAELSPADWRKEHAITLTGHGVHRTRSAEQMPAPWTQFDHVEFDSLLVASLKRAGFEQPTPIQAQSWPILLEPAVAASNSSSDGAADKNNNNKKNKMMTRGCDVVSIAKTGSGKTLGFLMPAFYQHLQRVGGRIQGYTLPKILVLAPTRELATQIMEQAQQFGQRCVGIRSVCCYGGSSKYPQIAALQRGVECIIATPGRLNDLIEMGKADLSQIQFLVLDEADRMLDMGFEPQIRSIIQQTNALTRQTCLFSATWPREIQALAHEFLYNPIQINVGQVNALVANKDIQQTVIMMQEEDKFAKLEEILNQLLQQHEHETTTTGGGNNTNRDHQQQRRHTNGGIPIANIGSKDHAKVIVFVAKKVSCHDLANRLWDDGYAVDSLHGDRPQWERTKVMQAFKSGPLRMLIATDVCARGLDVKDIGVVVNYDMPAGVSGVEDYVHRIGRTGRAGRKGVAYTFFTPSDKKNATKLVQVLKQSQQEIPAALQAMVRPPPRAGGGGRGYYGRGGGGRGGGRGYMSGGGGRGYMSGGRGGYGGGGRGGYGRGGGGGRGGYGRGRGGGGRGYRR